MKINEEIQSRRKQLGLTQEQVAKVLGVSAVAVHKWEKAETYPDITLLPPLARLLKTDLNTLLCFQEELTSQEVGSFLEEVRAKIEEDGYETGFSMLEEKINEYSSCDSLLISGAMLLEGAMMMYPMAVKEEEREEYRRRIEKLYERASQSEDIEIRNTANMMLFNRYLERKEYEAAEKVLDTYPKNMVERQQLQARLFIEQGKKREAQVLLERQVMGEITAINSKLIRLMELAEEEGEKKRADFLAELSKNTAKLYGLAEASVYLACYELAVSRKDKEACKENLKGMLAGMKKPWNFHDFELYHHISVKEGASMEMNSLLPGMLEELKRDKALDFLREDEEFIAILDDFSKI